MESNKTDLKDLFESAQRDLISAQGKLSALIASAAADPWLETQQEAQRIALSTQRDAMLQNWARLGLSWLLRGGSIQLTTPEGETTELTAQLPSSPQPQAVAEVIRRPARSSTVVQNLRRGSRPEIIEYTPPPRAREWRRPAPVSQEVDGEALRESLDQLTEPMKMETIEEVRNELDRLLTSTTSQSLMEWATYPKTVQRSLVGHVVARARHVQDELPEEIFPMDLSHDLDRIFSGMTAFSKREQPGFVFGLMRHHHPVGDNWMSDAKKWWNDLINNLPEDLRPDPEGSFEELCSMLEEEADEQEIIEQALNVLDDGFSPEDPRLVRLMAPRRHLLRQHTQFKKLRKAIRALEDEE